MGPADPDGRPARHANQVAWLEEGLAALRDSGLTEPREALEVILLLSGFVRNEATLAADIAAAVAASGRDVMPGWAQTLAHVTDAERFPALHAALASEAFEQDDDMDDEFVFGLARILDGVAALIAERR